MTTAFNDVTKVSHRDWLIPQWRNSTIVFGRQWWTESYPSLHVDPHLFPLTQITPNRWYYYHSVSIYRRFLYTWDITYSINKLFLAWRWRVASVLLQFSVFARIFPGAIFSLFPVLLIAYSWLLDVCGVLFLVLEALAPPGASFARVLWTQGEACRTDHVEEEITNHVGNTVGSCLQALAESETDKWNGQGQIGYQIRQSGVEGNRMLI